MCSVSRIFFNDTATTEIYTLSLHDALPIYLVADDALVRLDTLRIRVAERVQHQIDLAEHVDLEVVRDPPACETVEGEDRKSTRLNSSHANISHAVFCLKKNNPRTRLRSLRA